MTEERVRKIWAEYYAVGMSEREMKFAHTVAAESRKEGIDKMRDAAKAGPVPHRTNEYLDIKAERLREQGK